MDPQADWDDRPDGYVLSNGRELYAHAGILGLEPGYETLFYGSDGDVGDARDFTPEEREEIAGFMIAAWTEWKESK